MVEEGAAPDGTGQLPGGALFGFDCDDAVHQLYHYLDGELTEERREQISIHLDRCGPCAGAVHFEAELRRVIASRCKDRVPEALIQRVAAAIDEDARRRAPGAAPDGTGGGA
ncbi:MAG: mycothiol system anti-sigma-R factor [Acidimicrobiales bacterium]